MEQWRFYAILLINFLKIMKTKNIFIGLLRLAMGWMMLWAFFDKFFGLGFATVSEKSWLAGASPTAGFLQFGVHGPFSEYFHELANSAVIDWAFMAGLLFIGLALFFGIGVKIAGYSGAVLMLLMWLALLPPKNNPFLDEHIVYMLLFLFLGTGGSGRFLGLGHFWSNTKLVSKFKFLE